MDAEPAVQDAAENWAATLERAVAALRGMAYDHRLHILVLLRHGPLTPGEIATRIAVDPTAVAHHLRALLDARLVRRTRRGRNVFYSLRDDRATDLISAVLRYAGHPE